LCFVIKRAALCIQLLSYTLSQDETWLVWPTDDSLTMFVNEKASIVLNSILNAYSGRAKEFVTEVREILSIDRDYLDANVTDLLTNLKSFKTSIDAGIQR
jgi:hypothetical protein